jgi:hypothetical protein
MTNERNGKIEYARSKDEEMWCMDIARLSKNEQWRFQVIEDHGNYIHSVTIRSDSY